MALAVTSAPFQQVNMPALDLRRFLAAGYQEGILNSGDMAVAQRGAGANMSVDIAAGQALVQGDSITNQGLYYAYNDATFNLTGFSAANATNPRIDRVALRVRDAFHGDAANDVAFVIVTGTASAGATLVNLTGAAAVPAGHLLLANVLIPATATSITTANIDTTVTTLASGSAASYVGTAETTTSTTYVDLATVGPTVKVNVAGTYLIVVGAQLTVPAGSTGLMGYAISGGTTLAASAAPATVFANTTAAALSASVLSQSIQTIAANSVITAKYASNPSATQQFAARTLSIQRL